MPGHQAAAVAGVLAITAFTTVTAQIDPNYAKNLTVYHVNPASAGASPVNMDTGDVRGDLYFYLGEFLLPIECQNASAGDRAHFDCDNPERVDPNLVVTKVDMEVDSRMNTTYSACNLCNGTDPFTNKSCQVGSYVCDCYSEHDTCDPKSLGEENITEAFVHHHHHAPSGKCKAVLDSVCGTVKNDSHACYGCLESHKHQLEGSCNETDLYHYCPSHYGCQPSSPEWACWAENIPRKTGGLWYSTLKEGQCMGNSAPGTCSWKVQSMTTVKESCLKDVLMTTVESHGSECFHACGPRNATSPCWISCFFDTMLGVDARHSTAKPLGGIPMAVIEKGWTDAFLPKEQGGCDEVFLQGSAEIVV